ncbi:hypothetical protein EWM64_g1939 [Hericium alpestre]|uniref:Acyl-CoA thioesterase II domain-containing protein n=1 Tax=Hericium alpestre TaxID=135208 RepID=A0A4Z0A720_9AGAM|nr:hypothetical protein EWM64_g1939 [Hericium alpestre]
MADSANLDQAESKRISTALEVEQLDDNLFRSKELYLPFRARGVFGGQVISQAIVSATKCVSPEFALHSLHCYFLLSASPAVPIIYNVDRVRHGRTYTTRLVRANQRGRTVFVMICSFQIPEPEQLSHQWAMPEIPSPEQCPDEVEVLKENAQDSSRPDETKAQLRQYAEERSTSPIHTRRVGNYIGPEGTPVFMCWMKPKDEAILGYISDTHFLPIAAHTLRLNRFGGGVAPYGMLSSLDHSIHFYSNDFDCNDWILYMTTSPVTASGRGYVTGRMYSRTGSLIAITTQEGVVRARLEKPNQSKL